VSVLTIPSPWTVPKPRSSWGIPERLPCQIPPGSAGTTLGLFRGLTNVIGPESTGLGLLPAPLPLLPAHPSCPGLQSFMRLFEHSDIPVCPDPWEKLGPPAGSLEAGFGEGPRAASCELGA
jgi:hypothetical protein